MEKKLFYILVVLLILFFTFNYFVYTTSFDVKAEVATVFKATPEKYPSVLNFGDMMFDRGVRNVIDKYGRNPFTYIINDLDQVKTFDVIVANLEGPIVEMDRSKCQSKAYNFQFASTTPDYLKSIGISVVNIANNHSYDCYGAGFESTKNILTEAGIDYIGDTGVEKSYVVKKVDGKKIAFVGIDRSISGGPISDYYSLISKLKNENDSAGTLRADFVVVDIHWGTEYETKATEAQIDIAHALIDNGADVIFGHHPHVIEPVEIYKNKAIFYSLGNFVFDQDFGETTVGIGAGVEFQKDKSVFTILPFNIKLFSPEFMAGLEKQDFCDKFLGNLSHNGCVFEI